MHHGHVAPPIPRPADDPDRFDPATFDAERFGAGLEALPETGPARLDPGLDPDRFRADEPTLPTVIGRDEPRDTWVWALGLLSVFAFLALVSIVFSTIEP